MYFNTAANFIEMNLKYHTIIIVIKYSTHQGWQISKKLGASLDTMLIELRTWHLSVNFTTAKWFFMQILS